MGEERPALFAPQAGFAERVRGVFAEGHLLLA